MKWIGLTGSIATGKSTAKKLIEGLGHPVIDADLISHELTQTGKLGYQRILSHFGNFVLNPDQSLNRKALGQIIFNDVEKKLQLENILHPLIQTEVSRQRTMYLQKDISLCFYDVPLLFEKDLKKNFDLVVMVWCDPLTQKIRLMSRNQLTEAEANSRLLSQASMAVKIRGSDYCLDNSTDIQGLERQVQNLIQTIG